MPEILNPASRLEGDSIPAYNMPEWAKECPGYYATLNNFSEGRFFPGFLKDKLEDHN
jgi:hypothetical protein